MTDEDADRDPIPPGKIEEQQERMQELVREFNRKKRERRRIKRQDPTAVFWESLGPENHPKNTHRNPALWEYLDSQADTVSQFSDGPEYLLLAETIGKVNLFPHHGSPDDDTEVIQKYNNGLHAVRVYLYYDLAPMPEYRVADRLDLPDVRDRLEIPEPVSQSTLNRMPERFDDSSRHYYASQAETLVREWQDTRFEDWVRDPLPETISPDGDGTPPVQTLAQQLRAETFQYIRLKRYKSTKVSKDAAMRVLVAAANKNQFVNDAAKNLDLKEWYDGDEVPTGKTLNYHIQKSSREDITRMFVEANEPLFEIADDHGYFDGGPEVAIDLTDWPFFGDPDVDDFVRKTKSERNYWLAWKYIVLSLVGTDTLFILGVLPVRKKNLTPQYMRRLLRLVSQYVDVQRVYVDAATEFYSADAVSTVDELGMELVMQGRRSGSDIKHLLNGMARSGLESEYMSYGTGSLNPEDYWAVGVKSKKITKLREASGQPRDQRTRRVLAFPMTQDSRSVSVRSTI